jgi:thiosulfate reductase cytochrome b subunit
MQSTSSPEIAAAPDRRQLVKRHSLIVRITHWVNVVAIFFLLMSGLQIFNATPQLYLGHKADFSHPIVSLGAENTPSGPIGITDVLGARFNTTGFLGLSTVDGQLAVRGFPSWVTLPSYQDLATGRRWHFFFAWIFAINGAVYLIASLIDRHLWRDLVPSRMDLRAVGRTIAEHVRLHFEHVREYNVLQKLTYLIMVVVVLPLIVLAGMAMSPGLDAAFPWLVELFGGRQTARTVHFICAMTILAFVFVHLVMVLLSGVWNNLRSMITGRYAVEAEAERNAE